MVRVERSGRREVIRFIPKREGDGGGGEERVVSSVLSAYSTHTVCALKTCITL